jgi:hypothetical protein
MSGTFYAGKKSEFFNGGPYDSVEEAVEKYPSDADLKEGDKFLVGEGWPFYPTIYAYHIIEQIQCDASDQVGSDLADDYLSYVTLEEKQDLEEKLQEVLDTWLKKHDLEANFFSVPEYKSFTVGAK